MDINELRKRTLKNEKYYSKYATRDSEGYKIFPEELDFRPTFSRDIDRVLYTLGYMRYLDKTQVFSNINNDYITKRIIHVELVSKVARTIGKALNLNEDLIEAASLGHDLGHVPFGHEGEYILNELSIKHNEGYFNHNAQSVRSLMYIEKYGKGVNLNIQTLDAILCHNGEFALKKYYPKTKTTEEFVEEYENTFKIKGYCKKLIPMTLEGAVVRISDLIAYLGKDIEDAIRLKVINKTDIPKDITDVLGSTNTSIINTIICDIINNSYNKPYIKLSDDIYRAIVNLKIFNNKYIYEKSISDNTRKEYKIMFETVFDSLLKQLKENDLSSTFVNNYIAKMNDDYNKFSPERRVLDYIAGMTDNFFIMEYNKIKNKNNKVEVS